MDQHLTVSEARKFTGKSDSTINRLIRDVVLEAQHPERSFILPSHGEVERRKKARNRTSGRSIENCYAADSVSAGRQLMWRNHPGR